MDEKYAVNVSDQIARLRNSTTLRDQAHAAATLFKERDLRVVLVVMTPGARLHPHQADESVAIQVLEGSVRLRLPGEIVRATAGTLLTLGAGVLHDVEALQDSAFLIFLPRSAGRATAAAARRRAVREGEVDETVEESMPASDPPASTTTHAGGPGRVGMWNEPEIHPAEPERHDPKVGASQPDASTWDWDQACTGPPEEGQPRAGSAQTAAEDAADASAGLHRS